MVFPADSQSLYRLVYYERTVNSTGKSRRPKYCLSTNINSITRKHHDRLFPSAPHRQIMNRSESTEKEDKQEKWWEFCPVCGCKLLNHKCRFVCSNPRCHFFMSCSEFDM
jgi:hypothetical protein